MEIDPVAFADAQARRFTGRRLRVGRSAVVHDVARKAWIGDLTLPVAACNQGWAGLAATDDLMATDDPANCRKRSFQNEVDVSVVDDKRLSDLPFDLSSRGQWKLDKSF